MCRITLWALALSSPLALAGSAAESIFTFPPGTGGYLANASLEPGFELDASGHTIPAAYFALWSPSRQANEIWVTDGTPEGTHLASPLEADNDIHPVFISDTVGAFFHGYTDETGWLVYHTDGAASSSHPVAPGADPAAKMLGFVGGKPVVAQSAGATTSLISTMDPDTGVLHPIFTTPGGYSEIVTTRQVGFSFAQPGAGESGYHVNAFRSDGSPVLTLPVPPPNTEWDYPHRVASGTKLACAKALTDYGVNDQVEELNCSDGTVEGTRRPVVPGEVRGVHLSDAVEFFPVGDRLLFYGFGMWGTDGTNEGTFPLAQGGSYPCTDDTSGGVYLISSEYEGGNFVSYLMFTDGTLQGTRRVATLSSPDNYCTHAGTSIGARGLTYLQLGMTLYQTDGTAAGTRRVAGAPEMLSYPQSERIRGAAKVGQWLVFTVTTHAGTAELWRIDLDPVFADGFE